MKSNLLFLLMVVAFQAKAQEPDSSSALFSMREAEWNFARNSVTHGRNAAFVESFAEQSVIFTDKWITNGKQFWKERKESPVVLKWEPEFMDIAGSGDFGISTGPWEMQEFRPNSLPLGTGYFLTVWKKQANGIWKVILDAGSSTPPVSGTAHKFSFPSGADKKGVNVKATDPALVSAELKEAEKQMLKIWKENPAPSTYSAFLAPGSRLQLEGKLPSANPDSIKMWLSARNKSMTWNSAGGEASGSGDLAFTYGYIYLNGNTDKTAGHYVRIWKKQPGGRWGISIEMLSMN